MGIGARAGLLMVVCALASADGAVAATGTGPGGGDPGPGGPITLNRILNVSSTNGGTITGPGIDCPTDCTETFSYRSDQAPPAVRLTAARSGGGWNPSWSNCTPVPGSNSCDVDISQPRNVTLTWADVEAPTAGWWDPPPPDVVGPWGIIVEGRDNAGSPTVQFFVDGVPQDASRVTANASHQYVLEMADHFPHGSRHTVRAEARDAAGNVTQIGATTVTIDKQLDFNFTIPSHVKERPPITFTEPPDIGLTWCQVNGPPDTGVDYLDDCRSGWPALFAGPGEGEYRVQVQMRDLAGNSAWKTTRFTVDNSAPTITLTSPGGGAVMDGAFTPAFAVSDTYTPTAQIERTCRIDGGGFGSCAGLAASEGGHTLTVRARDLAGNQTERSVPFVYNGHAPQAAITSGPAEGALIRTRSVTFGFAVSDATAVARTCKVDQGGFGPCSGSDSHTIDGLNPGIHKFSLRAVDAAGHTTTIERQFVTDDPLPVTNTNSNTGTTADGPTPTPTPRPLVAFGRAAPKFSVRGGKTRVTKLTVSGLARGSTVEVSCKGKGCFRGTSRFTARGSELSLASLFKKRTLLAGATIEIRVAQPGRSTKVFRYTTQKGRKKPKAETLTAP